MAKPNETHGWAVKSEPEPKQFWMITAKAKNYHMNEPKAKPEIGVPVT